MTVTKGDAMDFKDWPKPPAPGSFDGFIYVETGDSFVDAANRLAIFGATGTIPQRVAIGATDAR